MYYTVHWLLPFPHWKLNSEGYMLRKMKAFPMFEKHLQKVESLRKQKSQKKKKSPNKKIQPPAYLFIHHIFQATGLLRNFQTNSQKWVVGRGKIYMNSFKQGTSWNYLDFLLECNFHVLSWCLQGWGGGLTVNQCTWKDMDTTGRNQNSFKEWSVQPLQESLKFKHLYNIHFDSMTAWSCPILSSSETDKHLLQ